MRKNRRHLIEEGHRNFITKQAYTEYRQFIKSKPSSSAVIGRDNFNKMNTLFWKEVGSQMINKEAGVFLERMGYFYIMMVPRKMVSMSWKNGERVQNFNLHTDSRIYLPTFVPIRNTVFKMWNMDRRFSTKLTKEMSKNLKSGKVYKSLVASLKTYLKIR